MRYRTRLKLALALLAAPLLPFAAGEARAQSCTPVAPVQPGQLVTPGKLQLAINPTLPPQQFVDSRGELQGINIELGKEIAKRLCLELQFVRMDFPPMIPALQAGRFDGIHTAMFWTEERSKVAFMVPYAQQAISVGLPPNSSLQVSTPDDLSGKAVVIEVNTYQERWLRSVSDDLLRRGKAPITIRGFATATEAMTALRAGQGDAAALLDYMAVDMTKRNMIRTVLFRLGGAPSAMAFRQRPVAEAVAVALEAMRKDGTYGALFDRYGLTPQPADQPFAIRGPGPG
ncbi:transporter substrate-binding domain-containing protein [Muricoccus pecuniae]|uniref:Polar amino acid transport system substrate-binding protein n=1 Tax=Muricoccus pecuniae TaxID=693023 RepID=A0A840Y5M1_9PROT|nr:transporter substrate-binding domain-containing protein [Roseomonas pecuniae]MBB5695446.1 polar amino acid transport system substrate-binding protein [Roseomonas pecuniae]